MKNIVCLYHANCVDGFVSKTLIEMLHEKENVVSIPVRYNQPITDITKRIPDVFDVEQFIIVDFSLPYSDLEILAKLCKDIIIYDHHQTAIDLFSDEEKIKDFNEINSCNLRVILQSGICTSSILYNLPYSDYSLELLYRKLTDKEIDKDERTRSIVAFIERINDYDIWNLEYDNTFVVNETVRCIFESNLPENKKTELISIMMEKFEKVCLYISSNVNIQIPYELINFVIKAKEIVDNRSAVVVRYVKSAKIMEVKGVKVPFVQCPGDICNYVGSVLSDTNPYVFTYWINVFNNTVKISLRSNKFKGTDVRKIAEELGGGGHQSAAGVEMSYDNFKLFLKLHVR